MRQPFITDQIVRLIQSFPTVASKLTDFEETNTWILTQAVSILVRNKILHVARVEGHEQPVAFSPLESKYLEENLMSLVALLIERSDDHLLSEIMEGTGEIQKYPEKGELPQNHLLTELESLFMTLYKMLRAFENNPSALDAVISGTNAPTILLFLKAAELSHHISTTGFDKPYNAELFKNVFHTMSNQLYEKTQWKSLSVHILIALDILPPIQPNKFDKPFKISTIEWLMGYTKSGQLKEIQCMMSADELTIKLIILENISSLLSLAAKENQYDTMSYLLAIYEAEAWYCNPAEDLSTPRRDNSLLGLALMNNQIDIASRIIALQKDPVFNKRDRDLVYQISDEAWNDPTKQTDKKLLAGFTLLHMAAKHDLADLIKPIIEQTGINPNVETYYSHATALFIAEVFKKDAAALVLREFASPSVKAPITGQKHDQDTDENNKPTKKVKIE